MNDHGTGGEMSLATAVIARKKKKKNFVDLRWFRRPPAMRCKVPYASLKPTVTKTPCNSTICADPSTPRSMP